MEMQDTPITLLPLVGRQGPRSTSSDYEQIQQPKPRPSARHLQHKNVLPCVLIVLGLLCCSASAYVLSSVLRNDYNYPTILPRPHVGQSQSVQQADDARLREIVSQTDGRYFVRDWPLYVPFHRILIMTPLTTCCPSLPQMARVEQRSLHPRSIPPSGRAPQPNTRHPFPPCRSGMRAPLLCMRRCMLLLFDQTLSNRDLLPDSYQTGRRWSTVGKLWGLASGTICLWTSSGAGSSLLTFALSSCAHNFSESRLT